MLLMDFSSFGTRVHSRNPLECPTHFSDPTWVSFPTRLDVSHVYFLFFELWTTVSASVVPSTLFTLGPFSVVLGYVVPECTPLRRPIQGYFGDWRLYCKVVPYFCPRSEVPFSNRWSLSLFFFVSDLLAVLLKRSHFFWIRTNTYEWVS